MTTEGTGTASTKPPAFSLELAFTALALIAQGFMTVELFAPDTVAGKLVSVLGIVLTGLGYTVATRARTKSVLPTALLVLFVFAVVSMSCTANQRAAAGRVAGDVVDCMTPAAKDAIGAFGPAMADVVRNATSSDGKVDWNPVKAVASPLKTPAQRCVLAAVIAEALRPSKPRADEPQSSPLQWDPASLAQGFEEVRAEWGGSSFKLESGTL